jgi:phosphoglycolate phosphatase
MLVRGAEKSLQAVLFDLDGTLIDSRLDIAAAANTARARYGLPALPLQTVLGYIGRGVDHLLRCSLGDAATDERMKGGLEALMDYYAHHLVDHTTVYPGVRPFLDLLQARGIPMGVVSNKPHSLTLRALKELNLEGHFGAALGADATERKKPHPEPLLTALKTLGAEPGNSVMIGDSSVDAQAGRAAGMAVGLVAHGFTHRSELEKEEADWVVDKMEEFTDLVI